MKPVAYFSVASFSNSQFINKSREGHKFHIKEYLRMRADCMRHNSLQMYEFLIRTEILAYAKKRKYY